MAPGIKPAFQRRLVWQAIREDDPEIETPGDDWKRRLVKAFKPHSSPGVASGS